MGHQFARLVMSHIDCDTIPFFWQYANRFTLFDNIFATEDTPSTPNAIAMIAGQSGETQWVKHGNAAAAGTVSSALTKGAYSGNLQAPPLVNDPQPFWGSQYDATTGGPPAGQAPGKNYGDSNVATNLTFASLPLTFPGRELADPDQAGRRARHRPRRHQPGHPLHHRPQRRAGVLALVPGGLRPRAVRTGRPGLATSAMSPTTTARSISATSPTIPAIAATCAAWATSSPTSQKGNLPAEGGVFYIRGGFSNLRH